MDNRNKETCKFCLKIIYDNNFDIIGEVARQMLDALLLKLNLSREESVMCLECATKLQNAVDFKTACLNAETKISSEAKGELVAREVNCKKNTNGVSEDQKVCRFCMNKVESGSCTDLQERKEYIFLLDMIQKYIPELCLNVAQEVVTCETCHASLQNLLSFITDCLQNEENVKEGMDTTEVKDELELNQDFTMIYKASGSAAVVEKNCDSNADVIVKDEIEEEDPLKIDNVDMDIKHEEMEIKSEENDSESIQDTSTSHLQNLPELESYTCQSSFEKYLQTNKNSSQERMYSSKMSLFNTRDKFDINKHALIHKDPSEIKRHKCDLCLYETKRKCNIKKHMLSHQDTSKVDAYKCEMCSSSIKEKKDRKHMLINQELSEEDRKHMLIDQELSKEVKFQCESCPYKTKDKRDLKKHVLIHKDSSEIKWHKCDVCSFKTKRKYNLKQHKRTHQGISYPPKKTNNHQFVIYQCEMCHYNTGRIGYLKKHMLTHQNLVPQYKCERCPYKTTERSELILHMQIHQDISESASYKCDRCAFTTRYKVCLERHILRHHKSNNIQKGKLFLQNKM